MIKGEERAWRRIMNLDPYDGLYEKLKGKFGLYVIDDKVFGYFDRKGTKSIRSAGLQIRVPSSTEYREYISQLELMRNSAES